MQNIEESFETLKLSNEETQLTQHDKETIEERVSNRQASKGANKMVLKLNQSGKEKMVLEMEDQDNMVNENEEIELNNEKLDSHFKVDQVKLNKIKESREKFEVDLSDADKRSLNSMNSSGKGFFRQLTQGTGKNGEVEFEY